MAVLCYSSCPLQQYRMVVKSSLGQIIFIITQLRYYQLLKIPMNVKLPMVKNIKTDGGMTFV